LEFKELNTQPIMQFI